MDELLTLEALRARYERDLEDGLWPGRQESFERALAAAGCGNERAKVASLVGTVFDACFSGHRDVATLRRDVADLVRNVATPPGAPLPPIAAYEPLANAFLHLGCALICFNFLHRS
jgi:hypothetical protein